LTATHTVGAASVLELDAAAAPPDMPLPDDCMAAAVLESDVPIMAVVVERTTGQASTAAACLASAPEESARRVVVPSARKAADGWFTTLLAMNVGPASATATVSLRDRDGNAIPCADDCTGVIEPYSSHQWRLADIDAIPDGTNASAVITSDEPMVVVVQDEAAENDTTLLRGAAADPPAASDVPQPIPALSHLPLLLNEVTRPTVPDTATPTPTGATPASPTSPPVVSPTPECTTHTTHMTLGASATEIAVGEAVTVTARLTNDGCAPVGLLAYHLRDYASGGPQAVLEPLSPITVSHPIELASGMTDEAVFVLGAVSAGTADLSAAVSFEVHLGDPGRAYWAGDGAGPVSVAVVDRSKRVYVPIVLRDHAF
jgi:hypothetical protein